MIQTVNQVYFSNSKKILIHFLLVLLVFIVFYGELIVHSTILGEALGFFYQSLTPLQGLALEHEAMAPEFNGEVHSEDSGVESFGSNPEISTDMFKVVAHTHDEMVGETFGQIYPEIDTSPQPIEVNVPRNLSVIDYDPGGESGDNHLTPDTIIHIADPIVERRGLDLFYKFFFPASVVGGAGFIAGFSSPLIFFTTAIVGAISWGVCEVTTDNLAYRLQQPTVLPPVEVRAVQIPVTEISNSEINLPNYNSQRPGSSIGPLPLQEALRKVLP